MGKDSSITESKGGKRTREEGSQSSSDEGERNHKRSRVDRRGSEMETSSDADFEEEGDSVEDGDGYQDSEEGEIYDSDNDKSKNERKGRKTSAQKQTRKPKPKPAARAERSPSSSENKEGTGDDVGLDIPDQKSNFQPTIVYNEHWSKAQEKRLRSRWSEDDDFLIKKSYEDEKALWRKTTKLFNCVAPDLIEEDVGVAPGKAISNPATKTKWEKNPNWSQAFCNGMGTIVCLPYLREQPKFLQYVLRKALHLRVGSGDPRAPRLLPLPSVCLDPVLDRIEHKVRDACIVGEDQLSSLMDIIEQEMPPERITEHWKFHEYLKYVVKKGERVTDSEDSCKLQVCDLDNIQNAWKLYNEKNNLQLPTMVQYREQYMAANSNKGFVSSRNTQSRQDDFKRWKKEWMLRVRRDAKIHKSVREARGRSPANNQEDYYSQGEEEVDAEYPDNGPFHNEAPIRSQRGATSTQASPRQSPGTAAASPAESQRDAALDRVSPGRDSLVPGANPPEPNDEMNEHWIRIRKMMAAEKERLGPAGFMKLRETLALGRRNPLKREDRIQMDRNLVLIDPRPMGKSTYMITLPYSQAFEDAICDESLCQIKEAIGVNIKVKQEGNQLVIYAEPDRGDIRLLNITEQLKRMLVLAHRGLKFWRWLVTGEAEAEHPLTELKVGFDKWLNTEDPDVGYYFSSVLGKEDDRFLGLKEYDDAPKQDPLSISSSKTTYGEEQKADDKVEQKEEMILPDGTWYRKPSKDGNGSNDWAPAGSKKPWERRGHAAQSRTGQANASSSKPGAKQEKGKAVEKPTPFQNFDPGGPMPGEQYSPFDDDDFSAFDPVGKGKKAAKNKGQRED